MPSPIPDPGSAHPIAEIIGGAVIMVSGFFVWMLSRRRESKDSDRLVAEGLRDDLLRRVESLEGRAQKMSKELSECEEKHRDCEKRAGKLEIDVAFLERRIDLLEPKGAADAPE